MRWSIVVGIVIALCLVLGGWWVISRPHAPSTGQSQTQDTATPATSLPLKPARIAPAGYIEYRNVLYRFSLFYPDTLQVKEYDEGNGAMTVTFQDVATAQGFQIFIVPYDGQQVSEARFKQDEPSGVRNGSRDVTIDGVTAASFYSSNAVLGDTAEIWFIHGGYLFEVTTLKPLAGWLSQIMMSWEFL
jgi:hypothetical protein